MQTIQGNVTGKAHASGRAAGVEDSSPRLAWQVEPFCRAIGIGRTKLYELINDGTIKTVVIGGRRLIPHSEAERLLSGVA
jgi:excisionase family DNA binding protein